MFPDLINLGFLHLHTYGACMAIGFVLCFKLIERLSGRKDISNLLMALMFSGVIGSRIAYVIEHWSSEFAAKPWNVVKVWNGGLMFYGGLVLAMAVFFVWCRIRRDHPLKLANLLATALPLGHACGRIGCFFFGCCYGRRSDSVFAVAFPRQSPAWVEQFQHGEIAYSATKALPVLPTQLFEAAALFGLFAWLWLRYRRGGRAGEGNAARYLMAYAVIRFALEFLRGDPRASVWWLSISQSISLGIFLVGAAIAVFERRQKRAESKTEG